MDLDTALTGKPAEGASATEILRADHCEARRLFAEYRKAADDGHARAVIAQSLCMQLELHDAIERDVFYPALRQIDAEWTTRASEAHAKIAAAAERVRTAADAGEPLADAIDALESLVDEHVRDEEEHVFPKVDAQREFSSGELGRALIRRKEELTRSTEYFEGPAT
jgi:hemerythrin superfamily protein